MTLEREDGNGNWNQNDNHHYTQVLQVRSRRRITNSFGNLVRRQEKTGTRRSHTGRLAQSQCRATRADHDRYSPPMLATDIPKITYLRERSIWIPYGVCILLSMYIIKNISIVFWGGPGEAGGDPYDKI